MPLFKELEEECQKSGDKINLGEAFNYQGSILESFERWDEALAFHKKDEEICREIDDKEGLGISLGHQIWILRKLGRLEEALQVSVEQDACCRESGDSESIADGATNRAILLKNMGRLAEALTVAREEKQLLLKTENEAGLLEIVGLEARILEGLDRPRKPWLRIKKLKGYTASGQIRKAWLRPLSCKVLF